ncbi:redox-sensitive transcriptional activator SoxR [Curvivirga sp.]|uniref:redox-sensitive transcriptional activator SoxR n=1 Tax=Curvivirga sp. TaxID=2856848 RepID=UPI003B5C0060
MRKIIEFSVGEVSRRAGVPISTIHFYEEKGLIKSLRTKANHRRYTSDVLRKLSIIKVAQKTGIPLKEIKEALNSVPDGEKVNKRHWQRLSKNWQADLDARIDQLINLRNLL